jgi:hypothetical protein
LSEKSKLPDRWQKEQRTVKAVQIAFDVGEEVQYLIRREALDLAINPPDRIRQILAAIVHIIVPTGFHSAGRTVRR